MAGQVFITGANGFIGRALSDRYRRDGWTVRGVDFAADPARDVVAGDVREPGGWRDHVAGSDLVIHTAAIVSMVAPVKDAWEVNCRGTRRLLEVARDHEVRRVIHLSSIAAFGFEFPPDVDEDYPLRPWGNSYVDTKIASEHTVLSAHAAGEVPCTIIRPGDVYGPGSRAWIVEPLNMMKAGQFILPDATTSIFSPVYIDDLVAGIAQAGAAPHAAGHIFNVTGGQGVTCETFFSHHWRWLGKPGSPRSLPAAAAETLAAAGGSLMKLLGRRTELGRGTVQLLARRATYSIEKARRLLGYEPAVDLPEGMRRSEAWVREQGLVEG
jgi:nucleoside-diphosphate-sugar epimerase